MNGGSSPLTRGKLEREPGPPEGCGLIPAHAGKTSRRRWRAWSREAHPRSRGENSAPRQEADVQEGSSPLTRGKLKSGRRRHCTVRLIPAHAGKTPISRGRVTSSRAHPRSRGENSIVVGMVREGMGSSPLTRGKHIFWADVVNPDGLIPAHAGKTTWLGHSGTGMWAHPRSRGENSQPPGVLSATRGSSPLTRGKRSEAIRRSCLIWAHPRSRGENATPAGMRTDTRGSSPLTRGKPRWTRPSLIPVRLIPAHAGSSVPHSGVTVGGRPV